MDIDVNDFKNVAAFSSMFAEVEGKPSRATMRQPDNYTTDPEAEVLVFDQIERRHILMILTDCQTTAIEWNAKRLGYRFSCSCQYLPSTKRLDTLAKIMAIRTIYIPRPRQTRCH